MFVYVITSLNVGYTFLCMHVSNWYDTSILNTPCVLRSMYATMYVYFIALHTGVVDITKYP
jgi:hypothetical protein